MRLLSVIADSTGFVGDPKPHLPVLRSLNEVAQAARRLESRGLALYVRYSLGPEADGLLGNSANMTFGTSERGLAFNVVSSGAVADGLRDYSYILWHKPQTVGWLATGTVVGTGSDGDPLLTGVVPIAWVHLRAIVEAICRADRDSVLIRMGEVQARRRGLPPPIRVELRPGVPATIEDPPK